MRPQYPLRSQIGVARQALSPGAVLGAQGGIPAGCEKDDSFRKVVKRTIKEIVRRMKAGEIFMFWFLVVLEDGLHRGFKISII
ncbi:hypothetical protein D3C85_1794500 [compost metagenome]